MDCQLLEDVGELFFLGVTNREDSESFRQHLEAGCPHCRERMQQAALTVLELTRFVRPARLSPKAKARLLNRLGKK